MPARQSRIGITMGDAAGIGPEVVVRALAGDRIPRSARLILYGSPAIFRSARRKAGGRLRITHVPDVAAAASLDEEIACINPTRLRRSRVAMGHVDAVLARAAMECVSAAVRDALAGELDAVVTAPINKTGLRRAGYSFSGHTDFLAAEAGAPRVAMMFVGGGLRVALVTIHEPLRKAITMIASSRVLAVIELLDETLRRLFGIAEPRIAVCGLNPHAGEGGLMGNEEALRIVPAVKKACAQGINTAGPFPADTLFARHRQGDFDAVVAMVHDQGLIPVKLLAFHSGVNLTLGLPFVRTSPDHGTAYDIAPRFIAHPGSMEAAIRLAARLARRTRRSSPC